MRRLWAGPLLGLVVALAALPLLRTTLFTGFEQKTVDARMRLRGGLAPTPDIAIVAIDPSSIDALGQWPWPRSTMADLIDRLASSGARVVALDMVFSEPSRCDPAEDRRLIEAIARAGNVVPGFFLRAAADRTPPERLPAPVETAILPSSGYPAVPRYDGIETQLPELTAAAPAGGHFVARHDSDGTLRQYVMLARYQDSLYPSLALRAVQLFRGGLPIAVTPTQGVIPQLTLGDETIPIAENGELWINWLAPHASTFPSWPAVDLLAGRVPREQIDGKIVFVGFTETGLADTITTPFDTAAPGVEAHATVADNLLMRRFVRDGATETAGSMAALVLLGLGCAIAATWRRRPWVGFAGAALVMGGYTVLAQQAFTLGARHLHLFLPLTVGVLAFTVGTVWRNVFAEARAREIRRAFQRYLAPAVVDELLANPDALRLGGERRDLSVLFADIRGFTGLSESIAPEETVALLQEYLTPMTRLIQSQGGTLDKYMGDGIMAFFGAPVHQPDHADRAARAALAMRAELDRLNPIWAARGLPDIRSGIGLNSGEVAVGNIGSETNFDYTVIGDNVNLASRLEGLTRAWGVDVIVSRATAERVGERFQKRALDRVRVKGRKEPVEVLELLPADELPSSFLQPYEAGLAAWQQRQFGAAARSFEAALVQRPNDAPTRLWLDRCRQFSAAPPPADWDGIV